MFQIFLKYICICKILLFMTNNFQFCCEKKFFAHESRPLKVASSNFKTPVCLNFFFSKNFKECNQFQCKVLGNGRVNFRFWNGLKASFWERTKIKFYLSFPRTTSFGKPGEENIDIHFERKKFIARSRQQFLAKFSEICGSGADCGQAKSIFFLK